MAQGAVIIEIGFQIPLLANIETKVVTRIEERFFPAGKIVAWLNRIHDSDVSVS